MKKKVIALIGGTALLLTVLFNTSAVLENNDNLDLAALTTLATANAEDSVILNLQSVHIPCDPVLKNRWYSIVVANNQIQSTIANLQSQGRTAQVSGPAGIFSSRIEVTYQELVETSKRICVPGWGVCLFDSFGCSE